MASPDLRVNIKQRGGGSTFWQIRAIAFHRYSLRQAGMTGHVGQLCVHHGKKWKLIQGLVL